MKPHYIDSCAIAAGQARVIWFKNYSRQFHGCYIVAAVAEFTRIHFPSVVAVVDDFGTLVQVDP